MRWLILPVVMTCIPCLAHAIQTPQDFEKSPFFQKYYPNDKTIQKSKGGYQIAQYVGKGLRVYLMLQPDATGNPRVYSKMISIDSSNKSAADRVEMFQAFAGLNDMAPEDLKSLNNGFKDVAESKASGKIFRDVYENGKFMVLIISNEGGDEVIINQTKN